MKEIESMVAAEEEREVAAVHTVTQYVHTPFSTLLLLLLWKLPAKSASAAKEY